MGTCGERIKFLRTKKGLTLEQLAEKSNISKGFLWEVENDRTDIGGERLLQIANVLGASLDFILRGDEKTGDYKPPSLELPDELVRLADEERLSFRDTRVLLEIEKSVYAKRRPSVMPMRSTPITSSASAIWNRPGDERGGVQPRR